MSWGEGGRGVATDLLRKEEKNRFAQMASVWKGPAHLKFHGRAMSTWLTTYPCRGSSLLERVSSACWLESGLQSARCSRSKSLCPVLSIKNQQQGDVEKHSATWWKDSPFLGIWTPQYAAFPARAGMRGREERTETGGALTDMLHLQRTGTEAPGSTIASATGVSTLMSGTVHQAAQWGRSFRQQDSHGKDQITSGQDDNALCEHRAEISAIDKLQRVAQRPCSHQVGGESPRKLYGAAVAHHRHAAGRP